MDFYKKIIRNKALRFKILSALQFIPDAPMLKLQYRIKQGRKLDLQSPERFMEKMQWYKLYYRNPAMQQCADKYTVREYVKAKGLGHILNDLYAVFATPEDITFEGLPSEFALKLSNGSSTNLFISNKEEEDLGEIRQKCREFVAQSGTSAGREWVYKAEKPPVIIAEKLLKDATNANGSLRDYKIFCFNGKPAYIICVDGRYTPDYCHVVYDVNWNKQNVVIGESSAAANYPKPEKLSEMLEYAEILSQDFPFARTDFYCIDGKIYFGEITFFPWSGYMRFTPDSFDYELGDLFTLPEKNN